MASADLRDRLKGMLLDTPSRSSSTSQPLIQVLGSENAKTEKRGPSCGPTNVDLKFSGNEVGNSDHCDDVDEGEDPPPIFVSPNLMSGTQSEATLPLHHSSNTFNRNPDALSLAEKMLADAAAAKVEIQKQQVQREKLSAKRSTFGVKKGFLNSSSSKAKRKGKAVTHDVSKQKSKKDECKTELVHPFEGKQDELIYELDKDGNIIPSSSSSSFSDCRQPQGKNPLHLTEVQSAMLSHLESNANLWAKPDLLDTIIKHHPQLARGMNDPRYVSALQAMQTNPKETLENLKKNSPEIVDWLKAFCSVMGEHFSRLSEEQDKGNNDKPKEKIYINATKVREMGPLEKKALKKHMDTSKDESGYRNNDAADSAKEMDERVSSVLANDELRSILMDHTMQKVMEDCSDGIKLRYYMSHAEHGPKLRKLMDAGLIKVT